MTKRDPYIVIDTVLMPWAKSHGIKVGTMYRDDFVRMISIYDTSGNRRAQVWLGMPSQTDAITVHAAEDRPDLPEKWGERLQKTATLAELTSTLDQLIATAFKWAGPNAFT